MRIVEPSVELLWITPEPEVQIERAGRTCYKSEDKITPTSAGDFCRRMRQSGHHAMLEHACASLRFVTDRGVTHEIVRHRLASYAQESTRYCNYAKDKFDNECTFIQPPGLSDDALNDWLTACGSAERNYFNMLERGESAQIARSVLPNSLKTEIVMTANLREWMHFIKLRASAAAHPQIRSLAVRALEILAAHAPNIFAGLVEEYLK